MRSDPGPTTIQEENVMPKAQSVFEAASGESSVKKDVRPDADGKTGRTKIMLRIKKRTSKSIPIKKSVNVKTKPEDTKLQNIAVHGKDTDKSLESNAAAGTHERKIDATFKSDEEDRNRTNKEKTEDLMHVEDRSSYDADRKDDDKKGRDSCDSAPAEKQDEQINNFDRIEKGNNEGNSFEEEVDSRDRMKRSDMREKEEITIHGQSPKAEFEERNDTEVSGDKTTEKKEETGEPALKRFKAL